MSSSSITTEDMIHDRRARDCREPIASAPRRGIAGGIHGPARTLGRQDRLGLRRATRIERIAAEKLGITGDTAVRLGKVLGAGPELWMNLQAKYETETAKIALDDVIEMLPVLNKAA